MYTLRNGSMEISNQKLTITFDADLAEEIQDLAAAEEMTPEEMAHELILEALEWRSAVSEAAEECGEDADFATILSKVLEQETED